MFDEISSGTDFQMSLLLMVALGGYILAARIHQSAVIGEILLGVLIGPSLLGWVDYTSLVEHLAELGAVVLLFVIGLEFKVKEVYQWKYAPIALAGVIVPWVSGYLLAKMYGYSSDTSIFVGTALTATSIAITATVLAEMKKLDTPAAKAIIGAAVIDDVLGLLFLSFSEGMAEGGVSAISMFGMASKAILFLVGGTIFGLLILSRIMNWIDKSYMAIRYPEFCFVSSMMMCFLYATVAEAVGLSAIVGAFVAGISLERVHLMNSMSCTAGADYLRIIFGAIFFVSLGILVDLTTIDLRIIGFLVLLIALAIASKIIGCAGSARCLGYNKNDSMVIGVGMVPRGEVAMIVALVGLEQGLIGKDIYAAIILMSLLTTIFAPLILTNFLYKQGDTAEPANHSNGCECSKSGR